MESDIGKSHPQGERLVLFRSTLRPQGRYMLLYEASQAFQAIADHGKYRFLGMEFLEGGAAITSKEGAVTFFRSLRTN
jgi:hypothetical protein